jgi:hypothetical protein
MKKEKKEVFEVRPLTEQEEKYLRSESEKCDKYVAMMFDKRQAEKELK